MNKKELFCPVCEAVMMPWNWLYILLCLAMIVTVQMRESTFHCLSQSAGGKRCGGAAGVLVFSPPLVGRQLRRAQTSSWFWQIRTAGPAFSIRRLNCSVCSSNFVLAIIMSSLIELCQLSHKVLRDRLHFTGGAGTLATGFTPVPLSLCIAGAALTTTGGRSRMPRGSAGSRRGWPRPAGSPSWQPPCDCPSPCSPWRWGRDWGSRSARPG